MKKIKFSATCSIAKPKYDGSVSMILHCLKNETFSSNTLRILVYFLEFEPPGNIFVLDFQIPGAML